VIIDFSLAIRKICRRLSRKKPTGTGPTSDSFIALLNYCLSQASSPLCSNSTV
jgi:hypothetical protein